MTQRPTTRRPVSSRPSGRGQVAARPMRRSRRVRRASGGLSPVRAGAMLGLLLAGAAIYGVAHSSAFTFTRVDLRGAAFTDPAAVDALLVDARQRNLFVLSTRPLVERLGTLPTVANAAVTVSLPNALVVSLKEREAILVWRVGERRYLADSEGNLFARMDGDVVSEEVAALPVVEDQRAASAGLSIGRRLEVVDRDAATRLASLRPSDVGSASARLQVVVTDASGFLVQAEPVGWRAVFGFYTPSLRTPELIPGQVRLLRSLLLGREALIDRIVLASETDGTYTTREPASPATTPASPAPTPGASP